MNQDRCLLRYQCQGVSESVSRTDGVTKESRHLDRDVVEVIRRRWCLSYFGLIISMKPERSRAR